MSPIISGAGGGGTAFSGARVSLLANQSLASGAFIPFDTIDWDTASYFTIGTPTLLTIPAGLGGRFMLGFSTDVAGSPALTDNVAWQFVASNKGDALSGVFTGPSLGSNPLVTMVATWAAVAGTTFRVQQFQGQAGNVTVSGGNDTSFWIVRLSA